MLINRENWKLHRTWFVVFILGIILSLFVYFRGFEFPGGSSTTGYLLGVSAGLIIVFEILLWPRKKLMRRWRVGRVRTWMSAHIWLGLLTVPLAIVHAGIPWGGSLATLTMILLLIVVGSGIFGLVLQQYIPNKMTQFAAGETIYSQIGTVAKQMVIEADALVSASTGTVVGKTEWSELYPADKGRADGATVFVGASRSIANIYGKAVITELPQQPIANSEAIATAYESQIRDYLEFGKKGPSVLTDTSKHDSYFDDLKNRVVPEAAALVNDLRKTCSERSQLDRQVSLHHWLHLWLGVHLPLAIALLVLVVWHAIIATKYSGIFSLF